jgi:hypothetical protein
MKLYIVTAEIDVSEDGTAFKPFNKICVSQAECAAARKELTDQGVKRKDITTAEVDVPTTKAELVRFLNLLLSEKYVSEGVRLVAAEHALTR